MRPITLSLYPLILTCTFLLMISLHAQNLPEDVKVVPFYDNSKVSFKDLKTTWMGEVPSLIKHFWVLDQDGQIWTLYPNASGEYDGTSKKKIADWSKECKEVLHSEYGAWGLAFHKKFQENGKFYNIYMAHPDPENPSHSGKSGGDVVVEEWTATGPKFDQLTKTREIFRVKHEKAYGTSNIAMGPDGFLYLALNDYETDSGDLNIFGRKILRLDIDKKDAGKEYSIPTDNPFVGESGKKPEIWAYGIRNGWSMNFDALTNDLWLADVGQGKIEEMNIVAKGRNHGFREGGDGSKKAYNGFNGNCANGPNNYNVPDDCSPFQEPEYAFKHDKGDDLGMACIASGVTYRADPSSPFYGYHIYGDVNYNTLLAHKKGETPHYIGNANDIGEGGHNGIVHYSSDSYGTIYTIFLSWDDNPHEIYRLEHADLKASVKPMDFGCTDPAAANFDETAKYNDGSCSTVGILGTDKSSSFLSISGFRLNVLEESPFEVLILDAAGKTVSSIRGQGPVKNQVIGKGLKGLYFISVKSTSHSLVKKVFLN